jgi:hypothetical protein
VQTAFPEIMSLSLYFEWLFNGCSVKHRILDILKFGFAPFAPFLLAPTLTIYSAQYFKYFFGPCLKFL